MNRRICAARVALLPVLLLALLAGCGGNDTYNPTVRPGAQEADFTLTAAQPSQSTSTGSASYDLVLTSVHGFNTPVTLSLSGLPLGVDGTFEPAAITPTSAGAADVLQILVGSGSGVKPGTYPFTATASGGGKTHSVDLSLTLNPSPNFALSAAPLSRTVAQGATTTYTITATATGGFSSPVALTVSGVPEATTATLNPTTVTPTAAGVASTLTVVTRMPGVETNPTPTGTYTLVVTGTGGGRTHAANVTLSVTPFIAASLNGTIQ